MNSTNKDDLFEVYQNDMDDNFKLDKSKIVRKKIDLPNANVQISLKIEYELLDKLKSESELLGMGYQTLLKNIARDYFKASETKKIIEELENMKCRIVLLENKVLEKEIKKAL